MQEKPCPQVMSHNFISIEKYIIVCQLIATILPLNILYIHIRRIEENCELVEDCT